MARVKRSDETTAKDRTVPIPKIPIMLIPVSRFTSVLLSSCTREQTGARKHVFSESAPVQPLALLDKINEVEKL